MMTVKEQNAAAAHRKILCLPMNWKGKVSPEFSVSLFHPLLMTALPAPDGEVHFETYRGWPVTWEAGYGFAAQISCHADDSLGYCDTIAEIREMIDDEIASRRASYGAHFHEDTPSLDDSFHRIEMDID